MTIRRGEDWGWTGRLDPAASVVESDRELHDLLNAPTGRPEQVGVIGGDLARTTGASSSVHDLRGSDDRTVLPVDLGVVRLDQRELTFALHVIVRRWAWVGPIRAVMNVPFVGEWNVAPRSHPNDGRLDLIEAELSLADMIKARPRLRGGTHVPHPGISISRVKDATIEVGSGQHVWVDGVRQPATRQVECRVLPDAFTIVI